MKCYRCFRSLKKPQYLTYKRTLVNYSIRSQSFSAGFHSTKIRLETFYETLGVPRDADLATIKKAFHEKAKLFHPDVNKEPGAQRKFIEVKNAFEVLSNPSKRSEYDNALRSRTHSQTTYSHSGPRRPHQQSSTRARAESTTHQQRKRGSSSPFEDLARAFAQEELLRRRMQERQRQMQEEAYTYTRTETRGNSRIRFDDVFHPFQTIFDQFFSSNVQRGQLPPRFAMQKREGGPPAIMDIYYPAAAVGTVDAVGNILRLTVGAFSAHLQRTYDNGKTRISDITTSKGNLIARITFNEFQGVHIPVLGKALSGLLNIPPRLFKGWWSTVTATDKDGRLLATAYNVRVMGERFFWFDVHGERIAKVVHRWADQQAGIQQWNFDIKPHVIVDPSVFILSAAERALWL